MGLTTYQWIWIGLFSWSIILIFGFLFMWYRDTKKEMEKEEDILNERLSLYANNNHPRIINRRRKR